MNNSRITFNLYSVVRDAKTKKYIKHYYTDKVDAYGVYCPQNETTYFIAVGDLPKSEGILLVEGASVRQSSRCRKAEQYKL